MTLIVESFVILLSVSRLLKDICSQLLLLVVSAWLIFTVVWFSLRLALSCLVFSALCIKWLMLKYNVFTDDVLRGYTNLNHLIALRSFLNPRLALDKYCEHLMFVTTFVLDFLCNLTELCVTHSCTWLISTAERALAVISNYEQSLTIKAVGRKLVAAILLYALTLLISALKWISSFYFDSFLLTATHTFSVPTKKKVKQSAKKANWWQRHTVESAHLSS